MIIILSGPVHSGKTSFLQQVISRLRELRLRLDGYLSLAVIQNGENTGYDLFDLATEKAVPFLRRKGKRGWPRVGRYFLIPDTLEKARQKITRCSSRDFLIIDEIGPLEISGHGVWPAFSAWLKKPGRGCLVVVRNSIVPDLLRRVGRSRVEVIDFKEGGALLKIEKRVRAWSEGRRGISGRHSEKYKEKEKVEVKSNLEWQRYQRQISLLTEDGQDKLQKASVLVAGVGGLGTAVSIYLAAAGIGKIHIVDKGCVDVNNLNRQFLFTEKDMGKKKAEAMAEKLREFNPHLDYVLRCEDALSLNLEEEASSVQVLVDALDNLPARFALNRAAIQVRVPVIHGSIHGFYGQITTIIPGQTPCLRCLFSERPKPMLFPTVGPVCGVIGCLQALEVIKYLTGQGSLLKNRLLLLDGQRASVEEIEIKRVPGCPDCGRLG